MLARVGVLVLLAATVAGFVVAAAIQTKRREAVDARAEAEDARKVAEGARKQAVLGRVGQTEDIANQVLTFVTSTSITGQLMVVDGGMPGVMR